MHGPHAFVKILDSISSKILIKSKNNPQFGIQRMESPQSSKSIKQDHKIHTSKQTKSTELQRSMPQKPKLISKGKNNNGLR